MNTSANTTPKANILVIDDTPYNLELLSTMLKKQGYRVRCAINASLALRVIESGWSDLILLDIKMPGMNGYELCQKIKAQENTQDIPVIFLSALDDVFDKQQAFAVGGIDYICKPFQLEEVLLRIEHQLTLLASKKEIERLNANLEQKVLQRTMELEKANQKLKQEIKQRQEFQEQLVHLATHDPLTNLPNRIVFMQQLTQELKLIQDREDYLFAVLFLDCDRFKLINDSLGHLVGDRILCEISCIISSCLSSEHTLARFGGDEFTILLPNISSVEQGIEIAQKIHNKLKLPFEFNNYQFFITASIGIVLGTADYQKPEYILRDADTAMYQAKTRGKACHQIFSVDMHSHASDRLKLETDLRLAIERQELFVVYQPIVSLSQDTIVGFEALVRWQHPERGLISPIEFIPIAEETGLIIPLDLWVMEEACRQLSLWQKQYSHSHLKMSVNLSVKQFVQSNLIEKIDFILEKTQLDSHNLKLEITESAIMNNPESATILFQELRKRHIELSIDDFGTGYSSLSYLHRFPVNSLKIDRSFVNRIGIDGENSEIIQAIVTLAHHLNMTIVAEGIETTEQKDYLKTLGCDQGQGYFFAKPLTAQAIASMLENSDSLTEILI